MRRMGGTKNAMPLPTLPPACRTRRRCLAARCWASLRCSMPPTRTSRATGPSMVRALCALRALHVPGGTAPPLLPAAALLHVLRGSAWPRLRCALQASPMRVPAGGGGGLKMMSGVILLKNCFMRRNSAKYGGAIEASMPCCCRWTAAAAAAASQAEAGVWLRLWVGAWEAGGERSAARPCCPAAPNTNMLRILFICHWISTLPFRNRLQIMRVSEEQKTDVKVEVPTILSVNVSRCSGGGACVWLLGLAGRYWTGLCGAGMAAQRAVSALGFHTLGWAGPGDCERHVAASRAGCPRLPSRNPPQNTHPSCMPRFVHKCHRTQ